MPDSILRNVRQNPQTGVRSSLNCRTNLLSWPPSNGGERESCRNQNEARKHSSTRRLVRYDRGWQIGHCCGPVGTNRTPVWIQVDSRRLVACSADPDSRLLIWPMHEP